MDNTAVPVEEVDFANNKEAARQMINNWVEEATNDKIKDLIKEGILTSDTLMVILNAVYFKGSWKSEFNTVEDDYLKQFYNSKNELKIVPTMQIMSKKLLYNQDSRIGARAVELDYTNGSYSMVMILPDNDVNSFVQGLTTDSFANFLNGFTKVKVGSLLMPKFKLEKSYDLKDLLRKMGTDKMFKGIDMSGMVDVSPPLFVSDVVHKSFIEVNEKGTEAAAATALVFTQRVGGHAKNLRFNRPFLFMLKHKPTKTPLFVGIVRDP